MLPDPKNYVIYPSVVPADKPAEMTITPNERAFLLFSDVEYSLKIVAVNSDESSFYYASTPQALLSLRAADGVLRFTYTFRGEQEYLLQLRRDGKVIGEFHIYALYEDLYRLTPLRGDFHGHSFRSDGKRDPAALAGHYREQGYDFFSLTDHNRYYPGGEIDEAYSGVQLGITRIPGEELHTPVSTVHIVHVGGSKSVTARYIKERAAYEAEVAAYRPRVPAHVPEVFREKYAMAMWATDQIHEAGGLAIFAHPYWIPGGSRVYNVCDELATLLLQSGMFDAYELVGCMEPAGTSRSLALWGGLRATGHDFAVVGSSDVHGLREEISFPHHFTICFAEANEPDAIIAAVRSKMTVAVEGIGAEYERRYNAFGELRLVSYAQFLLAHYFPERQRTCAGEGVAMRAYAMGAAPADLIEMTARMNAEAADRFFGRSPALLPSPEMLVFEEKWRRIHVEEGPATKGSAIDSAKVTRQL